MILIYGNNTQKFIFPQGEIYSVKNIGLVLDDARRNRFFLLSPIVSKMHDLFSIVKKIATDTIRHTESPLAFVPFRSGVDSSRSPFCVNIGSIGTVDGP